LFADRKADEGEQAIREGATKGPGRYLAVKLTGSTELIATPSVDFATPEEVEAAAEDEPEGG
jgi:hypothetical protein